MASRVRHFVRGDIDGFFGLALDNLVQLLLIDALSMSFRVMKIRKNPENPISGNNPTITELIDYEMFCGIPQAKEAEKKQGEVPAITVSELSELRKSNAPPFLLDVRKPFENEIATMGADQLIAVEELEGRIGELKVDKDATFYVHCKKGGRSAKAVRLLHEHGYKGAINVSGGITAWSEQIDQTVAKY